MRNCRIILGFYRTALAPRDHTGSRAISWLTEVNRRTHTCLMDTSIHMNPVRAVFVRAALVNTNRGDGSETGIVSKRPVHLKQPQAMGRTELEIVTGGKQARFHPYAVWSSLARTDSHRFLTLLCCVLRFSSASSGS